MILAIENLEKKKLKRNFYQFFLVLASDLKHDTQLYRYQILNIMNVDEYKYEEMEKK